MLRLSEHAGWQKAHSPRYWWTYDSRETSPKTCPLCLSLHMTQYRGDRLDEAFPYHEHRRVNAIKAQTHMPRDHNCRCVLRWAGSTVGVWDVPMGWLKHRPKLPEIPARYKSELDPLERVRFRQIAKHAPETWRRRLVK